MPPSAPKARPAPHGARAGRPRCRAGRRAKRPRHARRGLCAPLLDDTSLATALHTIQKRTGSIPALPLELLLDREATVKRWLDDLPDVEEEDDDADADDDEKPVASSSDDAATLRQIFDAVVK